jgi:hypothetical protein
MTLPILAYLLLLAGNSVHMQYVAQGKRDGQSVNR